jgi:hypothetical protein
VTTQTFRRHEKVAWRAAGGAVVCLPPAAAEPVVVSGSGTDLWTLLAEPITVDEAADVLSASCGVPAERIYPDIASALVMLAELGLLEVDNLDA